MRSEAAFYLIACRKQALPAPAALIRKRGGKQ